MAENVSDEAFACAAQQGGVVSYDDLEAARAIQAESAKKGVTVSLADVLIQQGVMTPKQRETVEKKLQAQQVGGIQQLGSYKLLKKLGEGGMGAVYLAEDTVAQRKVALKVLPKRQASDSAFLSRFRREAQASGKLNHINIVSAYTIGEDQGFHFIAMEYCEGEPLDRLLKREQRLSWDKAVEIVMQVARGLKHAHENGFIHRDIKPANIMLCRPLGDGPNVAKILDLGLAKTIGSDERNFLTQTGVALGTPHYISPEQAKGEKNIDGRTDIYSLGATFYHLVTGQTPFQGSTAAVIMTKHLNEQLPNPQDINADIPDGVAHVITRMMAKEPKDRYRDCKELLDDLELVIDGKTPSSQAIDTGWSSVAMRRVAQAAQPAGRKPAKAQQAVPLRARVLVPTGSPPNRKPLHIGAGVVGLGVLALIVVLAQSGNRDREVADSKPLAKAPGGEAAKTRAVTAPLATTSPPPTTNVEPPPVQPNPPPTTKVEPPPVQPNPPPTTKVEPPPGQPDTKVAQPDTKENEALAAQDAAKARAEKAQKLFSAVLKETAPLLAQNKFADAIAFWERKAKDPALADAAELLKQEKADVESVLEMRRAAIEALRKQVGQQVTLKKGGTAFKGKVVNEPKPDAVTLDMGGAQMTFSAMQLSLEDVDEYAPGTGNVGADLRQRGIMYLDAGNAAKAKEYFTKPQTLKPEPYLDRIAALELREIEAAALKAWEKAEKLFTAKDMKGAKAAYGAFERDHGKTQTAAKQAAALKERYDAIEKVLGPMPEIVLNLGGGVKMEMVLVKAGEFMMGADDGDDSEKPVHRVKISQPFYIGKYVVTVAQFRAFADAMKFRTEAEKCNRGWTAKEGKWQEVSGVNWQNPGFKQEDNHPVVVVTWNDAQEFCKWATKLAGRTVRLPTEAEWEYAARGPKSPKYPWGDKWDGTKLNHADVTWRQSDAVVQGWGSSNDNDGFAWTAPVGSYKNAASWCGAFDMAGGVWERCEDFFNDKYYRESPPVDPKGPATGEARVLRGGSWNNGPGMCRAALRHKHDPGSRDAGVGFRVVVVCGSSRTP